MILAPSNFVTVLEITPGAVAFLQVKFSGYLSARCPDWWRDRSDPKFFGWISAND